MMDWQPIETAPKDGRLILMATSPYEKVGTPTWSGMYCAYWNEQDDEWHFHREGIVRNPVHWMDLPAPPKQPA